MPARQIVVAVLLGLAALVVILSAAGLVLTRDPVARLHFLTPVSSIAGPLVGVGYLVDRGVNLDSGLVLVIVAVLAFTGPPLGSAIARLTAVEREVLPEGEPR